MKIQLPRLQEPLPQGSLAEALEEGGARDLLFRGELLPGPLPEDLEFRGCIFQNCRLGGQVWSRPGFWDCSFRSCDLAGSQVEEGYFQRSEWLGCRLTGLSAPNSVWKDCYLEDCGCRLMNLSDATVKVLGLNRCDCQGALLRQWKRGDCSFHDCDLGGCNFFHTPLAGLDFSSCQIQGLVLEGPELRGLTIDPSQAADLVGLLGIKLR